MPAKERVEDAVMFAQKSLARNKGWEEQRLKLKHRLAGLLNTMFFTREVLAAVSIPEHAIACNSVLVATTQGSVWELTQSNWKGKCIHKPTDSWTGANSR